MKYIIYDFNGTILDDLDLCIKCINHIAKKYLNRSEITKKEYLEIFDFPVIDYYRKVGFDFDIFSFEKIGREWMDLYEASYREYKLMDGIKEILIANNLKGYKNIILSASKLDNLIKQCEYLEIREYFDEILGIDDIYAGSKEYIAKKWIQDKNPDNCIFIGDTLHDLDVANAIGVKCALVARGHQAKYRLEAIHDRVYDDISEVKYD